MRNLTRIEKIKIEKEYGKVLYIALHDKKKNFIPGNLQECIFCSFIPLKMNAVIFADCSSAVNILTCRNPK